EACNMGWHGLEGDRRFAFRRLQEPGDFPWLTAGKFPELVRFAPLRNSNGVGGEHPTHIRTPDGVEMDMFGEDLAADIGRRYGAPVQMMEMKHGIFDEACISVIASATVQEIAR